MTCLDEAPWRIVHFVPNQLRALTKHIMGFDRRCLHSLFCQCHTSECPCECNRHQSFRQSVSQLVSQPTHVSDPVLYLIGRQGFGSVYRPQREGATSFAQLLEAVAAVDPEMRVRFTSPHPKEFSDSVLQARNCQSVVSQSEPSCELCLRPAPVV